MTYCKDLPLFHAEIQLPSGCFGSPTKTIFLAFLASKMSTIFWWKFMVPASPNLKRSGKDLQILGIFLVCGFFWNIFFPFDRIVIELCRCGPWRFCEKIWPESFCWVSNCELFDVGPKATGRGVSVTSILHLGLSTTPNVGSSIHTSFHHHGWFGGHPGFLENTDLNFW